MPISIHTEAERLAHPQACFIPMKFIELRPGRALSELELQSIVSPEVELETVWDDYQRSFPSPLPAQAKLAFLALVLWGHPAITTERITALAVYGDFSLFHLVQAVAMTGRMDFLDKLIEQHGLDEVIEAALTNGECLNAVLLAIEFNELDIYHWFFAQMSDEQVNKLVVRDVYKHFRLAAAQGYYEVLEWLIDNDLPLAMTETDYFEAFRDAAHNGHLAILQWLAEQAPDLLLAMIEAHDFWAFCLAAANGHLDVLQWLAEQEPDQLLDMVKASYFLAFREAAENGHLIVLKWLAGKAPTQLLSMIEVFDFKAFRNAAGDGHLDILQWLAKQAPDQLFAMIEEHDFGAFCWAAQNSHMDVLQWMMEQAPHQLLNMIKAFIRNAAANVRLEVLKWLLGQVSPDQRNDLLEADCLGIFAMAVREDNVPFIQHLLSTPILLAHAERHAREYSQFTHPFIVEQILDLRTQAQMFECANPAGVFDLSAEKADWYFYAMRHLIRCNDPALLDDLRFLLGLPRLKNLAHQDSQQRAGGNELLRLAQSVDNGAAAQILLAIPAVRNLAEANHYYRAERRGELDLSALARDHENSMCALTEGEQRRLATITHRYQAKLRVEGVEVLFKQLRDELRTRYLIQPAKIKIDSLEQALPVEWAQFVELKLNATVRDMAFKAYYQHPTHTALRYVSKPNRWIASNASYVYINETRTERWSTFEEYKSLIALLWLAAQDVEAIPTDDYTVETRITHFIRELAYIGRAHNWDRNRPKLIEKGRLTTEEYDDEEGDKPSCYSGVKRRLFQALQGHPDMLFLSADGVNQELREYLRQHFKAKIDRDEYPHELCAAWDACVLAEPERAGALERLNLNEAEQQAFTTYLTEKYGTDWLEDSQLKRLVDQAFKLEHANDKLHAVKFAGLVNLESLLPVSTAETGVTESKECEDEEYSAAAPRLGR